MVPQSWGCLSEVSPNPDGQTVSQQRRPGSGAPRDPERLCVIGHLLPSRSCPRGNPHTEPEAGEGGPSDSIPAPSPQEMFLWRCREWRGHCCSLRGVLDPAGAPRVTPGDTSMSGGREQTSLTLEVPDAADWARRRLPAPWARAGGVPAAAATLRAEPRRPVRGDRGEHEGRAAAPPRRLLSPGVRHTSGPALASPAADTHGARLPPGGHVRQQPPPHVTERSRE